MVKPSFLELRGHSVEHGGWLERADIEGRARKVLLGPTAAATLFGEAEPVGSQVVIKGQQFSVIGVMSSKGRVGMEDIDNIALMPITTAQEIFGVEGFHGMFARHVPGIEPAAAAAACRAALAREIPADQDIDELISVLTIKEATNLMDSTLAIFRVVLGGIASIALIVGGIGIMNVMLIRVLQRRLEIGIRLASGASQRDLQLQFMIESALLALAGTAGGVALGIAGVLVYCAFAEWRPAINPLTVGGAAVFCFGAGMIFGIAPAVRASRTDPVECLRSEV
jgi:putative ABC transport system permease protein